jgi:hypothetical protein
MEELNDSENRFIFINGITKRENWGKKENDQGRMAHVTKRLPIGSQDSQARVWQRAGCMLPMQAPLFPD